MKTNEDLATLAANRLCAGATMETQARWNRIEREERQNEYTTIAFPFIDKQKTFAELAAEFGGGRVAEVLLRHGFDFNDRGQTWDCESNSWK